MPKATRRTSTSQRERQRCEPMTHGRSHRTAPQATAWHWPRRHPSTKRMLWMSLLVTVVCACWLMSCATAEPRVTLTNADGTKEEIGLDELMARQGHPRGSGSSGSGDQLGSDDSQSNELHFADEVDLSKKVFEELKRYGYADGLQLSGFTDKEAHKKRQNPVESQMPVYGKPRELNWRLTASEPRARTRIKYDVQLSVDDYRGVFSIQKATRWILRPGINKMHRVTLDVDAKRLVRFRPSANGEILDSERPLVQRLVKAFGGNPDQMGSSVVIGGLGLLGFGALLLLWNSSTACCGSGGIGGGDKSKNKKSSDSNSSGDHKVLNKKDD